MNFKQIAIDFLNLLQELGYHYEDLYADNLTFNIENEKYFIYHYGKKITNPIEDKYHYIFDSIPQVPIEVLNIEVNKLRIIDEIEEDKVRKEIRLKRIKEQKDNFDKNYNECYGDKDD